MKVRVKYTASFYADIEVPDDATIQQIGWELNNVHIPEDDVSTYVADSFEPAMDDSENSRLYDQDNEPTTLAEVKKAAAEQWAQDLKRCAD